MIRKTLIFIIVGLCLLSEGFALEPLRVFIRGGEKTHAPGAHEYPQFVKQWKSLLEERGAVCKAGLTFPNREQLAETDVLILHAKEAGNIEGENRSNLESFLQRGGGLVVIHAGSVSRDPDWYREVIGGSWRHGTTQFFEGHLSLYFTDRRNAITKDLSNFDLNDEIYYDMDILPEVHVLAAAYTPKLKEGKSGKGKGVNIYDIQPQIWTYENSWQGAAESYRSFVCIPGHWQRNFDHLGIRTLLLRGIAWAGKRKNVDEFCKAEELGDALRYVQGGVPRPEKLVESLEVHPEFDLSLVAAEPLISNPLDIDWDEKGRLWVCESPEYPNGRRQTEGVTWMDSGSLSPGDYNRDALDRISILSDEDGDGVMDHKKVFADKLELATSFVFHRNGVIVSAAPDIWLFQDTDGDDVADKRTRLYSKLGNRDTHSVINNLRWGQDGWIYATHGYSGSSNVTSGDGKKSFGGIGSGVVRFKADGSAFEQYASKGGNTWGLSLTTDGEVFYTQPTTGNPLVHVVLPEYVLAKGKLPGLVGTQGLLPGAKVYPAMTWEQTAYVQIDQVGGYTAGAGCVVYEGGAWPAQWKYRYFTTEPTVNVVGNFLIEKNGANYRASREEGTEGGEFIRSSNLWFRPIGVRTGPDGALYVVDFCNQAIIHNDTRGPKHGPGNAAVRPDRDHYYGRIWRVQHKQAKVLPALNLARGDKAALEQAVKSPNKITRNTALRLLREDHGVAPLRVGSEAVRSYERALASRDNVDVVRQAATTMDDWTLSALVAASSESGQRALQTIEQVFEAEAKQELVKFVAALMPAVAKGDVKKDASIRRLLQACSKAGQKQELLVATVLTALSGEGFEGASFTPELKSLLKTFLQESDRSALVLPLISRWDRKGELEKEVVAVIDEMLIKIGQAGVSEGEKLAAARSLLSMVGENDKIASALQRVLHGKGTDVFKSKLVKVMGASEDPKVGGILVARLAELPPSLSSIVFEQVIKRKGWTNQLLDWVDKGELSIADLGPANVARLRRHPDKMVASRAKLVLGRKSPEVKEKAELIAKLTAEVEKSGDREKGELLFNACSVCHRLGGVGVEVGPALDGMGAHGSAELLVHILDPNREVDPSFWAYNITTKKGETYVGVITSENAAAITLATQGGVKEIAKSQIVKRENTRRSLMPEGFEAFGVEGLRDLLAYICGDAAEKFRVIDMSETYNADSRSGIFVNSGPKGGVLQLPKTGDLTVGGVPFYVQPAAKSRTGANLVVLKGGPGSGNYSQTFPRQVEIETTVRARKLHLLSGIGGWAYPAQADKHLPVLQVEVQCGDGDNKTFVLRNGVEFADYIRRVDVPGSAFVKELSHGTQVRWITLDLERPRDIKKIILRSFDNRVAPVVVAMTADVEGIGAAPLGNNWSGVSEVKKGREKRGEKVRPVSMAALKWEQGKTRVLLIGGGTSHEFKKFFGDADRTILEKAGFSIQYTEDREQAIRHLAGVDVAVISVNRKGFDSAEYRKTLMQRIASGKGVVMLHPGVWYGYADWPELNEKVVGGGSRGHDKLGGFQVELVNTEHPVVKGVTASFEVIDELYHVNAQSPPTGTLPIKVLAQTSPSQKYGKPHPSVWVVENPDARIVGIALGHDERVHGHADFQRILTNAVQWVAGK